MFNIGYFIQMVNFHYVLRMNDFLFIKHQLSFNIGFLNTYFIIIN